MSHGIGMSEEDYGLLLDNNWVKCTAIQHVVSPERVAQTFSGFVSDLGIEDLAQVQKVARKRTIEVIEREKYKEMGVFYLGCTAETFGYDGVIEINGFGVAIYEGLERVVRIYAGCHACHV